jgi:transcriptional regulator with GAF, ATPase, and Fis domain
MLPVIFVHEAPHTLTKQQSVPFARQESIKTTALLLLPLRFQQHVNGVQSVDSLPTKHNTKPNTLIVNFAHLVVGTLTEQRIVPYAWLANIKTVVLLLQQRVSGVHPANSL